MDGVGETDGFGVTVVAVMAFDGHHDGCTVMRLARRMVRWLVGCRLG